MANKSIIVKCRVTPEEYQIILGKAKEANMNMSRYLSMAALGKSIIVIDNLKPFTHQLSKIGVNLNQLTILAHQGKLTCIDLVEVKKVVTEIWQLLISLTPKTKRSKG